MSKLYFYYGTMASSKTMQLLVTAYNYESQGKNVLTIKPQLNDRDLGIQSRVGLSRDADIVLSPDDNDIVRHIRRNGYLNLDAVLIDEIQFLSREQILSLTDVVDKIGVPVIGFGLLTDFTGNLFDGSKALVEYADKISEIKTVCYYCNTKATMNLRLMNGRGVFEGETIQTGDIDDSAEISYKPVCRRCFKRSRDGEILLRKK